MSGLIPDLARGAVAGVAATGVMTLGQLVEMRVTGRPPSTVPGQVAARLFRVRIRSDDQEEGLTQAMHWGHGAAGGILRGVLWHYGKAGPPAFVLFGQLWTIDALLYKQLGIADWPWKWAPRDLAIDVLHKGTYVIATDAFFRLLKRQAP